MKCDRRSFLIGSAAATMAGIAPCTAEAADPSPAPRRANRIAVSTYSFWQFRHQHLRDIEKCIDLAADIGFDGVEILHRQMEDESNNYLQQLKRRAFANGLDLCGFSTHQTFLSPHREVRQKNVKHTLRCIELAYRLGIPTMRVNTGTWGTSKSFDDLMQNRGLEPPLKGYSDEDGFRWVIDGLGQCLRKAEECGVVLGLENHWGLRGRSFGRALDLYLLKAKALDGLLVQATDNQVLFHCQHLDVPVTSKGRRPPSFQADCTLKGLPRRPPRGLWRSSATTPFSRSSSTRS
jgi:hypothetical protein